MADTIFTNLTSPIVEEQQATKAPTTTTKIILDYSRYPDANPLEREHWARAEQDSENYWGDLAKEFWSATNEGKASLTQQVRSLLEDLFKGNLNEYLLGLKDRALNTAVQLIWPEKLDLLVKELYRRGGAMYEEYINSLISFAPKDPASLDQWREKYNNLLLSNIGTDFLTKVSEPLQTKYLEFMMPGVLEEAELKAFKTAQIKKIGLWLAIGGGGLVGTLLLFRFMGGKKKAVYLPAPQ